MPPVAAQDRHVVRVGEQRVLLDHPRAQVRRRDDPERGGGDERELLVDEGRRRQSATSRADGRDHEIEASAAELLQQVVRDAGRDRDPPAGREHRRQGRHGHALEELGRSA